MTVEPPAPVVLAVDLVVLTLRDDALCALLVRRAYPPFAGELALPGGFVGLHEALRDAATRELAEETGVRRQPGHLEQLATYGDPGRDPRGRVVSVAFLALAPDLPDPVAGTDAAASRWAPVGPLLAEAPLTGAQPSALAFDHLEILRDGVERARSKIEYSPVATAFCPPEFTVAQLRRVYELVWDTRLDPRNFHRKVTSSAGFLVPTGQTSRVDGGRPAELFRPGLAPLLHPAMLRPTPARHRTPQRQRWQRVDGRAPGRSGGEPGRPA
nr:NUDIX domain-containing protein [Pseudofrankia sp. DC12]